MPSLREAGIDRPVFGCDWKAIPSDGWWGLNAPRGCAKAFAHKARQVQGVLRT